MWTARQAKALANRLMHNVLYTVGLRFKGDYMGEHIVAVLFRGSSENSKIAEFRAFRSIELYKPVGWGCQYG